MAGTISDELRQMFTRIDTLGSAAGVVQPAPFAAPAPRPNLTNQGAMSRITNSVFMHPDHQVHRLKPASGTASAIVVKDGGSKVNLAGGAAAVPAKTAKAQSVKPKPWLLIAIVVVLVLMVAAVAGLLFFRRSNKRKQEAEAKRMQLEAQRAQEEEALRAAAEAAAKEKEAQEEAAKARQTAAKESIARQAAEAIRRQQNENSEKQASIPVSVFIPSAKQQRQQQREASNSSRVQVLDEKTQKPASVPPRAPEGHVHMLDATVSSGIETLREGVKQSILSQRLHDTEPQRDASVLLSRPAVSTSPVVETRASTAASTDANAVFDAVTKPIQTPTSAVVVGSTASAGSAVQNPEIDSSAIPSV